MRTNSLARTATRRWWRSWRRRWRERAARDGRAAAQGQEGDAAQGQKAASPRPDSEREGGSASDSSESEGEDGESEGEDGESEGESEGEEEEESHPDMPIEFEVDAIPQVEALLKWVTSRLPTAEQAAAKGYKGLYASDVRGRHLAPHPDYDLTVEPSTQAQRNASAFKIEPDQLLRRMFTTATTSFHSTRTVFQIEA